MVFVDAENISKKLFRSFHENHPNEHYMVFGKKNSIGNFYLNCNSVEFINCFSTKNSADTFMTAYLVDSIYNKFVSKYYLLTHDNDLSIAIKMLTDNDREVVIACEKGKKIKNLREIGANISLISFEEYDVCGCPKANYFVRISRTPHNCHIYDACPNRAWFKCENGVIIEVPFRNDMPLTSLRKLLMPYRKLFGVGSEKSWKDLTVNCYLGVHNDKVYWLSEEELNVL